MKYIQTDEPHLLKDEETGVVVSNDNSGYQAYLAMRAINDQKRQKAETMEQELDQVKEDVKEIKEMLKLLLEKK